MSEERHQNWIPVCFSAGILLSPLVYLLSVGRFVWLFKHGYIARTTYERLHLVYKPLLILRDNCEPFRWIMDWYVSWFQ